MATRKLLPVDHRLLQLGLLRPLEGAQASPNVATVTICLSSQKALQRSGMRSGGAHAHAILPSLPSFSKALFPFLHSGDKRITCDTQHAGVVRGWRGPHLGKSFVQRDV